MTTTPAPLQPAPNSDQLSGRSSFWDRRLLHYPDNGKRTGYLAITVLATVILYYELYVQGAVATRIIRDFGFSFPGFVTVAIIGAAVGAFASIAAGLADRWGRANLVVWGLLLTGLIILFGLPNATSQTMYTVLFALLSLVEGIVLVATPALVRGFSPQVGRASAMGFWAIGPVLGALLVTLVSTLTLDSHPDWRFQFYVCGIVGLVVFVIALLGLRELSPALRDQVMVSLHDRALIEARAANIDPDKLLQSHWRQMLRFDIVGSAFAASIFQVLYYTFVAFLVVYFATVYGYTEAQANSLGTIYWITNAITLIVVGRISDRVRVRKPFMIVGAIIAAIASALFALAATNQQSYGTIAVYFIVSSFGIAMVFPAWLASFTETVEKHNPAAVATALAINGWMVRAVVVVSYIALTVIVPATSALVDQAPPIQAMQAEHPKEFSILTGLDPATSEALAANPTSPDPAVLAQALAQVATIDGASEAEAQGVASVITSGQGAAAQAVDPATLAALAADPTNQVAGATAVGQITQALGVSAPQAAQLLQSLGDPAVQANLAGAQKYGAELSAASTVFTPEQLSYLKANGPEVAQAAADGPRQWQTWWWICTACQVLFMPFVFLMAGRWSPRRAKEDELAHEAKVDRELAAMRAENTRTNSTT